MRKRASDRTAPRPGVARPETARERRERAALDEDLTTIPLAGKPLPVRARFGRPTAEAYLAATRGPLPYMLRLREIDARTDEHERRLRDAWLALAVECARAPERFEREWRERAATHSFDEVNDLIERHNLWYPVESRLPMDPQRGDHALVNGRDYRLGLLDESWVLERMPPELSAATASAP